jgi:glycosyltransferase involved in cell wall biosynthesis
MSTENKIRVLSVPSDHAGVGAYRNVWPSQNINKYHSDKFYVEINHDAHNMDMTYLKQFDIIHFHRHFGPYENMEKNFKELNDAGVITVMDIDDYWAPPKEHPLYHATVKEKMTEKVTTTLKMSNYVTTTTDIFAQYIKPFNKNVFVIPNAIETDHPMWKDEDTRQTDKVRISWIGGSCLKNDMEILTEEGFKFVKDLNESEKVACLNPTTNELEFHKPLGYIKQPYNGKLNCGTNNLIDYAVTPNHNMFVSVPESLTEKKLNFKLIQSDKVHGKNMHFKKDAIWKGTEQATFVLSKIYNKQEGNILVAHNIEENKTNKIDFSIEKYHEDLNLNMDMWLKFFGFWIAEGWTTATPGLYQVGVAQTKNNGYLEEIFDTLKQLGFNPTYTKDLKQVRVFDKRLWNYLSQFGKAENKHIPYDILNLCPRQLNILLEWYIKGDGSQENNGKRFDKRKTKDGNIRGEVNFHTSRKRGYTVSKKLADNLQELCLKIGVISTITNRGLRNSIMNDGRIVNGKHDAYVISIGADSKRSRKTPLLRSEDQYTEDYNDFVYCVEVPHNIIYVRRNGKTCWVGNSHQADLELIKPSINILHNDVNLQNTYQIVMCGYDVRGFFTILNPDGTQTSRKIEPHETIWNRFEEIFTDNYNPKLISAEYKKHLQKYKNIPFEDQYKSNYVRRWTLPLTQYGKHYNYCDVCLAPLAENTFNEVKSELKIIESGMKKKVLIAQDFGINRELIKHGENGILVNKKQNIRGWYEAIKSVIVNPEYREMLANNLHEFVKDKYNLRAVTHNRADFYELIYNKHKQATPEAINS